MKSYVKKTQNQQKTFAPQEQNTQDNTFQLMSSQPNAQLHTQLQEQMNNSPQMLQMKAMQELASNNQQEQQVAQLQSAQGIIQRQEGAEQGGSEQQENKTGLPDDLKSGVEALSGLSMDDTKVHYNSDKPAQLQAHAYAQGNNIHIASGQEKHLPHEAWHVVQQKQGRVKPTTQLKGKVNINDDQGLEHEADVMGRKAAKYTMLSNRKQNDNLVDSNIGMEQPVQRALSYDSSAKSYNRVTIDGKRPWWNSVDAYLEVGSNEARCHVISFEAIRLGVWHALVEYMYGAKNFSAFDSAIARLRASVFPYGASASTHAFSKKASQLKTIAIALYNHIATMVNNIKNESDESKIVEYADNIVMCMNSSPDNLRAADSATNSSIGSALDPRGWEIDKTQKDSKGKKIFVITGTTALQLLALTKNERRQLIELYKDDNTIQNSESAGLLMSVMKGGGRDVYIKDVKNSIFEPLH